MISADAKANKNNNKYLVALAILYKFLFKTYLQNLKYNVKGVCIFHLILVGILSISTSSFKNKGGGCLIDKIC